MSKPDVLDDVRRWFRYAEEDLNAAEALLQDDRFIPRHVCWLSQQAAEKAIKGLLTAAQTPFPFRHDLDALRNLLPEGSIAKREHPDLAELTEWAVEARYPGDWQEATVEDAAGCTPGSPGVRIRRLRSLRSRYPHQRSGDVRKQSFLLVRTQES